MTTGTPPTQITSPDPGTKIAVSPTIGGRDLGESASSQNSPIQALDGEVLGHITAATHWQVEAAIETATSVQKRMGMIPVETRIGCVRSSAKHLFQDENTIEAISRLTGATIGYVCQQIADLTNWGADFDRFARQALPGTGKSVDWRASSPTFLLLPSNGDAEIPFLLFQVVLAGSATVIRPSRRGSSALSLDCFLSAWSAGVDEVCQGEEAEALKSAFSSIPLEGDIPWSQLAIDGWNYLLFGSNETLESMEREIQERCHPRRVLGFGTGLSTSIVMPDADLESCLPTILASASANAGNECIATDIVYLHEEIAEEAVTLIGHLLPDFLSDDPHSGSENSIGRVSGENLHAIVSEVEVRGKMDHLRIEEQEGSLRLHLSAIPLTTFETALEYPGPVFSIRCFSDPATLRRLVRKDLSDNQQERNLVTSVFCGSDASWEAGRDASEAWLCRRNLPTHDFDPMLPHQGVYVARELAEPHFLG